MSYRGGGELFNSLWLTGGWAPGALWLRNTLRSSLVHERCYRLIHCVCHGCLKQKQPVLCGCHLWPSLMEEEARQTPGCDWGYSLGNNKVVSEGFEIVDQLDTDELPLKVIHPPQLEDLMDMFWKPELKFLRIHSTPELWFMPCGCFAASLELTLTHLFPSPYCELCWLHLTQSPIFFQTSDDFFRLPTT